MQTMSRRRILAGMGAGAAAVALASCTGKSSPSAADPTATTLGLTGTADELGQGSFTLFAQSDLNFQTLFALGEAGQNAAAGEVIAVVAEANSVAGGATYQSVYDAWIAMGNRLEEAAVAAEKAGHTVTARSSYIRAAKYYAQALYWVLGTSTPGAEKAVYTTMNDAFVAGMKLMATPTEQVAIPYDKGTLPGWFMKPAKDDTRRPTIILNNGSDGQNVDMLAQGGLAALERGYNVLIFEGPGQGSQLFVDNVPFRPDWQNVITPIVDWLGKRSDVATDKIALRGISFGGLLTPQAVVGRAPHRRPRRRPRLDGHQERLPAGDPGRRQRRHARAGQRRVERRHRQGRGHADREVQPHEVDGDLLDRRPRRRHEGRARHRLRHPLEEHPPVRRHRRDRPASPAPRWSPSTRATPRSAPRASRCTTP